MYTPYMTSGAAVGDAATPKLKCPKGTQAKRVQGGHHTRERLVGNGGSPTRDRDVLRERWGIGKRKAKRPGITAAVYITLWLQ